VFLDQRYKTYRKLVIIFPAGETCAREIDIQGKLNCDNDWLQRSILVAEITLKNKQWGLCTPLLCYPRLDRKVVV
jgi:hypothetical protein